jgi:hypothetical protein
MALYEEFHVVADEYAVNASATIVEGDIVKLAAAGVILCDGGATEYPLGVAGDTKSTVCGMPGVAVGGAGGANVGNKGFTNRVSDPTDETLASGRITVYHGGGRFATNRYVVAPAPAWAISLPLYSNAAGQWTTAIATAIVRCGICVAVPAAFRSGIPGVDVNGDISLGNYMEFRLDL